MEPALLRLSTRGPGETLVLHYLTERDHPWLRAALSEHARFVGRRRSVLRERLREPLAVPAPKGKLSFVARLLDKLGCERVVAAVPPREARELAFRAAAGRPLERERVLEQVAGELRVSVEELEVALFADLESEQRVCELPEELGPARLALDANLALVRAWIRRAVRVRISAWGDARALVRHARWSGLICSVRRVPARDGVVLDVSGPFSLFRHTELYGRALAGLVPRAAACDRFEMVADCAIGRGKQTVRLVVRSGDPIGAGRELSRHDSRLEERFVRSFRRAAPDWDVIREPRPVEADGTLIFPDFELVHRRDPERRWLLELVGFWTPDYLTKKLQRLRAAGLDRLVLCIDARRQCTDADLPAHARVLRYKTRIDPAAVLSLVSSG